jgi:hypothetical protein
MNELLLRRRVVSAKPYNAEIEYLQSDGTAYIDLGITPYDDLALVVTAKDFQTNSGALFGARVGYNDNQFVMMAVDANYNLRFDLFNQQKTIKGQSYFGDHTYGVKADEKTGTVDGVPRATFSAGTFNCPYTIHIFGYNNGGTHVAGRLPMKVKVVSLFNQGVVYARLIPVRKEQVGYLYCEETGVFYGNAGTGSFILGPDV